MKKFGIIFVGALIVLLITAALFLPSEVPVERSIVIEGKPEAVFAEVQDLHRWEKWSPWYAKDPNMKLTYSESPAEGVGASYSWESESQGSGTMTITKVVSPRLFEAELDFGGQGTGTAHFWLEPMGENSTRVAWGMVAHMGNNPIGKLFGLRMESMVAPDFEDGLSRLKTVVEEKTGAESEDQKK